MPKSRMPKSVRKFIRKEKARIRREVLDLEKQKEKINELYQKFIKRGNKTEVKKPIEQKIEEKIK